MLKTNIIKSKAAQKGSITTFEMCLNFAEVQNRNVMLLNRDNENALKSMSIHDFSSNFNNKFFTF